MALSQIGNQFVIWSDQDSSLLNDHINIELSNFATYQAISAFLDRDTVGLRGLALKFRREATDELSHAQTFIDFQNSRGGKVNQLSYQQADIENLSVNSDTLVLDVYKLVLELEKKTFDSLSCMHESTQDAALQDLIEQFLQEQIETQKELNDTIQRLKMGGGAYCAIHEDKLIQESLNLSQK